MNNGEKIKVLIIGENKTHVYLISQIKDITDITLKKQTNITDPYFENCKITTGKYPYLGLKLVKKDNNYDFIISHEPVVDNSTTNRTTFGHENNVYAWDYQRVNCLRSFTKKESEERALSRMDYIAKDIRKEYKRRNSFFYKTLLFIKINPDKFRDYTNHIFNFLIWILFLPFRIIFKIFETINDTINYPSPRIEKYILISIKILFYGIIFLLPSYLIYLLFQHYMLITGSILIFILVIFLGIMSLYLFQ